MLFGNLMNNYFYGKAGKGDYRIEDMPANRFQLFRTTVGVRWGAMVGLNLLYVLIWLPAVIWTFINYLVIVQTMEAGTYNLGYLTMYFAVMIPLIGITGPFTAGVSYVTRNWARDQHSFVLSDFWDAVKGNWKQAFGVSFITGLVPFLVYMSYAYYGQMMSQYMFFVIPMGLVFMVALVWILSLELVYTMMVTYSLSFRNLLRNSILLTIARLPFALAIKLATLAITILAYVLLCIFPDIQVYVILVWALYYLVFGLSFNRMIYASYANAQCEKYLNSKIEGAQTNIGLRPENWDDTEYRPEDDE